MPQLDAKLPAFQLTSAAGELIAVDDLVVRGPVVLAAVEADGDGDPRAEMLSDLAERLGGSDRFVVMSPGDSTLGSGLAAAGGATWLQDPTGEAFAALGLTYRRIGRNRKLGGLFVIDADRRLRFAFTTAERDAWIPGSFVLSRLDRLGAAPAAPAAEHVEADRRRGRARARAARGRGGTTAGHGQLGARRSHDRHPRAGHRHDHRPRRDHHEGRAPRRRTSGPSSACIRSGPRTCSTPRRRSRPCARSSARATSTSTAPAIRTTWPASGSRWEPGSCSRSSPTWP